MSQNTTFEVHVQRGSQWVIHETYKGHEREDALEDAKLQLSQENGISSVKVVKETLDPDSGIFDDSVIFEADASKRPAAKKTPPRRGQSTSRGEPVKQRKSRAKKITNPKESITIKAAILRVTMVIFFSICIAALFAVVTSELLGGVFILVFLISACGLAIAVMRNVKLKKSGQSKFKAWFIGWRANAQRRAAAKISAKQQARAPKPALSGVAAGPSAETMAKAERAAEEPKAEEKQEEAPPPPEPVIEEAAPADPAALLEPAEKLKTYMLGFLDNTLKEAGLEAEKFDNFNKFGVSMYMAGACEILSRKGNMDALSQSKILAANVQPWALKNPTRPPSPTATKNT